MLVEDLFNQYSRNVGGAISLKKADPTKFIEQMKNIADIGSSFARALEGIKADQGLNERGRAEARTKAGKDTLDVLRKWLTPIVETLNKNEESLVMELEESFATWEPPSDLGSRLEAAFLRAEIRKAAAGLDEMGRELLYRGGDALTRFALRETPMIDNTSGSVVARPYVHPASMREMHLSDAMEKKPEISDGLEDVETVKKLLEGLASALEQDIEKAAPGSFGPPSITVM